MTKLLSNKLPLLPVILIVLSGCSASKFVPEGSFLLGKVVITSDNKDFQTGRLKPYIRQKANSKWFSVLNVPLGIYALSGKDSTKWINETLRGIGENPILFDSAQARLTCDDLENVMHGMGHVRAKADYELTLSSKKKITITYKLHPGPLFHLGKVRYDIRDEGVAAFLKEHSTTQPGLQPGMPLRIKDLDDERKRITALLNNNGYFNFHKDFITFSADTVEGGTQVDLTLHLHKYTGGGSKEETPHRQYTVDKVNFHGSGEDTGIPLGQTVLEENTMIEEGKPFNADNLQKTYNRFGRLPIIKYTSIKFTELPDSGILNCDIGISTNKTNSVTFQLEGTNTAGDLGAAASLTYENRNFLKGAETFSIKLRGAFEAITGLEGYQNQDYKEYNLETKLVFPRFVVPFLPKSYRRLSTAFTEFSASYNMQSRPEFHRRVFTAGLRYRWNDTSRKKSFKIDLVDLNYIYMPWISATFKRDYLDDVSSRNSILRYNYEDLFIMKLGFGMAYNGTSTAYKINVETAGNFLSGMSELLNSKVNGKNQHTLFNIAFAQYVKGDFDYTKLVRLNQNNNMAFHFGFGMAYPYGNSKILPFEKRYFSGGANSVRGWSVRQLGPGKFKGTDGSIDFINQTGDIKLDMSVELRSFLFWKLYGAVFVDAGNIWTLRYYEEQQGGQFDIKEFYKQIAVAYGIGIRLHFDFFTLRFDMGMKAINPAYDSYQEHYVVFHPDLSRDFAFHFAVGLPF